MTKINAIIAASLMCLSQNTLAAWQLDNDNSNLNFISTKKADVAEIHTFKRLTGSISDDAKATFSVDLTSVATGIEVRDTRLQEMLFETGMYPKASFNADISQLNVEQLNQGESKSFLLKGELSLHGVNKQLSIETLVTRLNGNTLLVVSKQPVLINAADFSLAQGVIKLKDIAKLPSISNAVPVNFILQFTQ